MLQLYNINHNKIKGLVNYKDFKVQREINKIDILSFLYPISDSIHDSILEECYIRTKDNEYTVKEINNSDENYDEYVCKVNIEDISGKDISHYETVEQTCFDSTSLALVGTGWAIGSCDITKKRTVRKNNCTAYDVLQEIQSAYGCEMSFDAVNKKVYIYQQMGSDKGAYFSDQLNLKSVNQQRNSYDYVTRLIPLGKDGLNITSVNGGKNYIENFQYSSKVIAEYWEDNRYTVAKDLLEDAITRLDYLSKPLKSYSADVYDLAKISKLYSILDYSLGDTITLLSKNRSIKEKQRIVRLTEYPEEPEKNTVEIANKIVSVDALIVRFQDTSDTLDSVTTVDGRLDGSKVDSVDWTKVKNISIGTDEIQDDSITTVKIGDAQITEAQIADASISNAKIQSAAIDTANIQDVAITNAKIANAAIDSVQIRDAAVTNAKIANAAIGTANIQYAAIGTAQIAVGAITTALIDTAAVGTEQIADSSITDAKIVALTANKITAGTIDCGRIDVINLHADNITVGKINGKQVDNNTITSDNLAPAAVTANALSENCIGASAIAANAITSDKIVSNAITSEKLAANSVTANAIASNTITSSHIASGTITAKELAAGTITSDSACIASLNANWIKAGTLSGIMLNGVTVNGSTINAVNNLTIGNTSGGSACLTMRNGSNGEIGCCSIGISNTNPGISGSESDYLGFTINASSGYPGTVAFSGYKNYGVKVEISNGSLYVARILGEEGTSPEYINVGSGNCRIDCTGGSFRVQADSNNYMRVDPSGGGYTFYVAGSPKASITSSGVNSNGYNTITTNPNYSWSGSISSGSTVTITHNLGHYPIVAADGSMGNIQLTFSNVSTSQIKVCNYNGGSNPWNGTIRMW